MASDNGKMEQSGASGAADEGDVLAGRYLTFCLGQESYGASILRVREIISMQEITRVPDTESHLKGVINLRGQVIAVMDLRLRLGMLEAENPENCCVIILESEGVMTGVIVDRVEEVIDLTPREIQPPAQFVGQADRQFILGMGKTAGRVVLLIDTDQVIAVPHRQSVEV